MVLIITSRPTSFSCHSWCTNKNYFSPAVTVRIVTSVHPNAGRFLSFVYILQTTWMSNKEKPVENPNRGRKKQNDVDVVVINIIAIKREKRCRISVYFAVRETVWYVSMYYLWTAFCSLPESLTNSSQQAHKLKRSPSTRLVPISYTSYHLFFSATNPPALCGCDHRTFFKPFFFHFIFPKQTDLIIGCDWLLTELFVSHDSGCSYINVLVAVLQTADWTMLAGLLSMHRDFFAELEF